MTEPPSGAGLRRATAIDGDMLSCWLCRGPVVVQALFCHHCGAVQANRDLDHFTRLGQDRRFDIDLDLLHRHYDRLQRALDPLRFVAKGIGEQTKARQQLEISQEAYDILRDPIRRARYLLGLLGIDLPEVVAAQAGSAPIELPALRLALGRAQDPAAIDRVANQAAHEVESCICEMAAAFRAERYQAAATCLGRLESLEEIAFEARTRRSASTAPGPSWTGGPNNVKLDGVVD
ncbi:MAG: Fe-S protein assembly co-chaperone HscB [Azospirillum sp.]|nr:Fe-S protein assembly co-chaperone HscB [Azospirillum sp.]